MPTSSFPIFTVYESINLGLYEPSELPQVSRFSPTLVPDPLYEDTFYIYHNRGAHAVVMKGWLENLRMVMNESESEEKNALEGIIKDVGPLEKFWKKEERSEVSWIVSSGQPKER